MEKKNLTDRDKNLAEIKEIVQKIQDLANELEAHPDTLTRSQILRYTDITQWTLRKFGGLGGIKKSFFPITNKELAGIRKLQKTSQYVAKLERDLGDKLAFEENVLDTIEVAVSRLNIKPVKITFPKADKKKKKMTMELMVSDIHYGLITETFNLEICRQRIKQLAQVFITEYHDNNKLFNVEKFIVALLGDLIQSFSMHGLESALSSEFGNPTQVDSAIESLFFDLIYPLAELGVPIVIPAVTGNHDRSEKNRTFVNPGANNLTWIIYRMLERLSAAHGFDHVKFIIPKDSYTVLNIYGSNVLYEHGDNAKANTKRAYEDLLDDRSRQVGEVIHFGRFGHYHEYSCYDRGRIIVNESVCGQDSYAKVKGFKTSVGQTINYYVETKNRPTSFYRSFPVYLG